jgi:TMEM175 potassium channel family protein
MTSVDPPEPAQTDVRAIAVERLTFFADAVIAIAITLLALDLPVPQGDTNAAMWHSALANAEAYLAFAISFLVISRRWAAHHQIFRYVTHLDGRLRGLTMAWLFTQIVTPFATRVIVGEGAFQVRFGFYVLVQLVSQAVFTLMVREVESRHLYRDDTPPDLFRRTYFREIGMAVGFAVAVPVSFVTQWAYALWALGPLTMNLLRRFRGVPG